MELLRITGYTHLASRRFGRFNSLVASCIELASADANSIQEAITLAAKSCRCLDIVGPTCAMVKRKICARLKQVKRKEVAKLEMGAKFVNEKANDKVTQLK